jgi:hypothetical protein
MGTTTFSGPLKAGTIKDTTGTTVGTNVANVGYGVMAQSAVLDNCRCNNNHNNWLRSCQFSSNICCFVRYNCK